MNQETKDKLKAFAELCIAAAEGKTIQVKSAGCWFDPVNLANHTPFSGAILRIKPDPSQEVARGWNPKGLTVADVGEGWRLLDQDECDQWEGRQVPSTRFRSCGKWHDSNLGWWGGKANILSTRLSREALAALDKPAWKLPEPPEGKKWWMPEAITEEMHKTGYRPLLEDELSKGDGSDEWQKSNGTWVPSWSSPKAGQPHRTRAELPAAPEYWSRPEHVPGPVCWIRSISSPKWEAQVCLVNHAGVVCPFLSAWALSMLEWEHMAKYEHSTDRINWKSCTTPSK